MPRVPLKLFGVKIPGFAYDVSISDPAFAALLNIQGFGLGAYSVYQAVSSPAFFRGVAATAGTIASLPLKTYKPDPNDPDQRIEAQSFLDKEPSGPYGLTPFAWKELIVFCLMSEGECGLMHVYTNSGALIGLMPFHPTTYAVKWVQQDGQVVKQFMVQGEHEPRYSDTFTQILGLSLDGLRGLSPVILFQRGIQLSTAMELAAMRQMTSGMHASGLIAPKDEDIDLDDAQAIQSDINVKMLGPDKAGGMIFVNKRLVFTPWTQNNQDAQFEQGRRFQREEIALMLGMPIYKLNPEKQSSWGTGVAEQNAGWARETLMPITSRIEEAVSPLLSPSTKFVEFDYKGLLQGTPTDEVKLILEQLAAGVLSEEESREKLGLGPKDPNDTFRIAAPVSAIGKPPVEEPAAAQQVADAAAVGGNGSAPAAKVP